MSSGRSFKWAWLGLVFGTACAQDCSDAHPSKGDANGKTEAAAPSGSPQPSSAGSQVPAPVAPPSIPPQLVACGERDFYSITQKALRAFEISLKVLPPQIRGSAVARQTAQVEILDPLNIISLTKKRVLVIAKHNVLRYQLGKKRAERSAPIPTPGPLEAWLDPSRTDAFWVRVLGAQTLHLYQSGAESSEKPLRQFDSRLFTVLADGTPLYSTPNALVHGGADSQRLPFPELSGPATLLFADPSADRYWAADASGSLSQWDRRQGTSPVFTARVPGAVMDVAVEGDRVAVLSMALREHSYRPSITVFSQGKQQAQLSVAPTVATLGQPELDLCLISGRPWVLFGSRDWLQLLDWSSPRLLAAW